MTKSPRSSPTTRCTVPLGRIWARPWTSSNGLIPPDSNRKHFLPQIHRKVLTNHNSMRFRAWPMRLIFAVSLSKTIFAASVKNMCFPSGGDGIGLLEPLIPRPPSNSVSNEPKQKQALNNTKKLKTFISLRDYVNAR